MKIEVTTIGLITLLILCAASARRPLLLLWCLPMLATLQTHALFIATLGEVRLGASLFNGAMLVAGTFLLIHCLTRRGRDDLLAAVRDRLVLAWLAFATVSVVTACVLPTIFQGTMIAAQVNHTSVYTALTPLAPNLNHLAQAVNAVGMIVILVAVGFISRRNGAEPVARALFGGFILAAVFACSVSVLQRAHYLGLISLDLARWATNPSLLQSFDIDYAAFGAFRRTALPFIEPSYASAWFAASAAASFALVCFASGWKRTSSVAFILSVAALANTISATGYIALTLWTMLFVLVTLGLTLLHWSGILPLQRARALIFATLVQGALMIVAAALTLYFAALQDLLWQVGSKWTELTVAFANGGPTRGSLNASAIDAYVTSKGLGLGTGSVKASGFLHGLIANVGVLGTSLFLLALTLQTKRAVSVLRTARVATLHMSLAYLAATSCLLISLAGGISDQNWPVLWVLIFFGYAISLCAGSGEESPDPIRQILYSQTVTRHPSAPPADSDAELPASAASAQHRPTVTSPSVPHKPAPK
jgi:hypothetical protein